MCRLELICPLKKRPEASCQEVHVGSWSGNVRRCKIVAGRPYDPDIAVRIEWPPL